jgi:hypothetical protein
MMGESQRYAHLIFTKFLQLLSFLQNYFDIRTFQYLLYREVPRTVQTAENLAANTDYLLLLSMVIIATARCLHAYSMVIYSLFLAGQPELYSHFLTVPPLLPASVSISFSAFQWNKFFFTPWPVSLVPCVSCTY